MNEDVPPPPRPARAPPARRGWGGELGIAAAGVGVFGTTGVVALVALRVAGLIAVYKIPSATMAPAINRNDDIFVEGLTYLHRRPARGEVITFKNDGLPGVSPGEKYVKRLVGLPGDRLRIAGGTLYVNDETAFFRNKNGEIHYTNGIGTHLRREDETFVVPADSYFVLGDNSPVSADSRIWGAIPAHSVVGRAVFCYEPAADAGWIR